MAETDDSAPRTPPRAPIDRIGVTVLKELVQSIVSGSVQPGDALPPEGELSIQFGASRTVIRESIKRLQEKGMVTVAQGRGTHVTPRHVWNVLDPLVLSTMISNDSTLGVLDDLSIVRGALESSMAAAAATAAVEDDHVRLRQRLDEMADLIDDSTAFREADIEFHIAIMELADNALASNIVRALAAQAVSSHRFTGIAPEGAFEMTHLEHARILEAIEAGDAEEAARAMKDHILDSWERRRLPSVKDPRSL